MKKLLLFLFILQLSIGVHAAYTNGTDVYFLSHEDKVIYQVLDPDTKTVGIAGFAEGAEDFLYCPDEVVFEGQTYVVTQINHRAFSQNQELYFIAFPSTLTDIGDEAFCNCSNLSFTALPEGLETIGYNCFRGASAIEKIDIPDSVYEIGAGAFAEMSHLRRIVMQNAPITEIKAQTFYKDEKLEEVFLPLTIKIIEDLAFYETTSLNNIFFPEGLEVIGREAFKGYSYHEYYVDGVPDEYFSISGIRPKGGLEKLELPSTLKELGTRCFMSAPISIVDLSKCVQLKNIPDSAFWGNDFLASVFLPEGLIGIGERAFCSNNIGWPYIELILPSTVYDINETAFGICIASVKIGDNVKSVPERIFLPSSSAGRYVEIGDIKYLGNYKMSKFDYDDDGALKSSVYRIHAMEPPYLVHNIPAQYGHNMMVVVPEESVEKYLNHPYWGTLNIIGDKSGSVAVTLDGKRSLSETLERLFSMPANEIYSLSISGPMTQDDLKFVAEAMGSLTYLNLYETTGLTEIPAGCFMRKYRMHDIILPESIETIGDKAFFQCQSLNLDKLPASLRSIGEDAFHGCSLLSITELPEHLEFLGDEAFTWCSSLRSITAGPNLVGRAPDDHSLDMVFTWCAGLEYVDLSKTKVEKIAGMFSRDTNLRTVLLPQNLKSLGPVNFTQTCIRTLSLPAKLTTVEPCAFMGFPIKSLSFEEGLTDVANSLCDECRDLITVSFPTTTKKLGNNLFTESSHLRFISCAAIRPPSTTSSSFYGVQTQKATLTVPSSSIFFYVNAAQWGKFGNFEVSLDVDVPDGIEVTVVPEENYEEMAQNEQLENDQLEHTVIPGESQQSRARRINAIKEQSLELLSGKHFAKVFDNAVIQSYGGKDSKGNRFFIFGQKDKDYDKVMYNNEDVTADVVDGQLLLPANASGKLKIIPHVDNSISEINANPEGFCSVYTIDGVKVKEAYRSELKRLLTPGLYIVRDSKGRTEKMRIN